MLVIVAYDISTKTPEGQKRLRRIARTCEKKGLRIQDSLFEINLYEKDLILLKNELLSIINPDEDSLRFYNLGNNYARKINIYGLAAKVETDDDLIL